MPEQVTVYNKDKLDEKFSEVLHVVYAGTDLTTARPTAPAGFVKWIFDTAVDVGANGENIVNGMPGDDVVVLNP